MPSEVSAPLLELRNVSKRYGGVVALDRVSFSCEAGTIHAILGENGAGKSTLIKIIAGVVEPDEGALLLEGRPMSFRRPTEANAAGVACVFQELSLLPTLSVAENLGLGMPTGPVRNGPNLRTRWPVRLVNGRKAGAGWGCRASAGISPCSNSTTPLYLHFPRVRLR